MLHFILLYKYVENHDFIPTNYQSSYIFMLNKVRVKFIYSQMKEDKVNKH